MVVETGVYTVYISINMPIYNNITMPLLYIILYFINIWECT